MDIRVNHFEPFKEVYGFVAGDDVLRFSAMMMGEVVDEFGTPNDFIGHPGGENFVIITTEAKGTAIRERLKARFTDEVLTHYNFMDREQGHILATNREGQTEKVPIMSIAIGHVSPSQQQFADIREITELAAESRRKNSE
jgi:GGDEF domain-containing protein